ncbi:MAG: hypothetical protein R3C39_02770 [Dehalococcoidia bacterium]
MGLAEPRLAFACSGDGEPAAAADVIIAGRVVDLALAPEVEGVGTPRTVAVRMTFEVDRYMKGAGPATFTAFDVASAEFGPGVAEANWDDAHLDELVFSGGGGACGALDADPRGQYWVAGLVRQPDGTLHTNRLLVFGIGVSADDPVVLDAIGRFEAASSDLVPPAAGGAGLLDASEGRDSGSPIFVVALSALVVAVALSARRVSR